MSPRATRWLQSEPVAPSEERPERRGWGPLPCLCSTNRQSDFNISIQHVQMSPQKRQLPAVREAA